MLLRRIIWILSYRCHLITLTISPCTRHCFVPSTRYFYICSPLVPYPLHVESSSYHILFWFNRIWLLFLVRYWPFCSRSNESLLFNADRWRACVIDPVLTVFWPRDFNLRWGLDEFTLVLIWFFEAFDCHEYLPRLKATRKDYHLDHFTRKKV